MCLTIDNIKTHKETRAGYYNALQAKRSIKVFKVLTVHNEGPYRRLYVEGNHEPYKKGFIYEETDFPKKTWRGLCEENGFHSCRTLNQAKHIQSYHFRSKIVTMYIPKGAYYFKGRHEDYFSSHLKYV